MPLQAICMTVCLFLAQVAADTGVYFVMKRHPDSYFCGHLQCVVDLTNSDHSVSSLAEINIYDITRVNSELKLASVSAFHPDLYVDTTKSSAMSCTGIISRLQANLTLQLRHDIDCLYGVYKCQLDFFSESGHPEVLTAIVIPEHNHNYSRASEMISHIDTLTTQVSAQTFKINNLGSQLDDLTTKLADQTALLHNISHRLDREQIEKSQVHDVVEAYLKASEVKLESHQQTTPMVDLLKEEVPCYRGMPSTNESETIIHLWNKTIALCDTQTDGGGWVVIQRIKAGDVDFDQSWESYKNGFGNPDFDHWIGNDVIHILTSQGFNELRIEYEREGKEYFGQWSNFSMADEQSDYLITVGRMSGTFMEDELNKSNEHVFSTPDRDTSCSYIFRVGWWFNLGCSDLNLKGNWNLKRTLALLWGIVNVGVSNTVVKVRQA